MNTGCKHGHLPPCTQCGVEETINRLTRELSAANIGVNVLQGQLTITRGELAAAKGEIEGLKDNLENCELKRLHDLGDDWQPSALQSERDALKLEIEGLKTLLSDYLTQQ